MHYNRVNHTVYELHLNKNRHQNKQTRLPSVRGQARWLHGQSPGLTGRQLPAELKHMKAEPTQVPRPTSPPQAPN